MAGVEFYDAGTAARDIIHQETSTKSSPLYGNELVVANISKGADPTSHRPAWVVTMESFDHVRSSSCLYLWGKYTRFQGFGLTYDIDHCPGSGGGWLVRIADHTAGGFVCVIDLPEHGAFGTRENVSVAPCGPPPNRPTPPTTSQAA